jgi:SNF2 family DNA or RNA helicase
LSDIRWRFVIVDEAHALKNRSGQLQRCLGAMKYDHLVLLTGTPLQNNVQELWALLRLINPRQFESMDDFIAKFGDLKTAAQLDALQKVLQYIMLRRQKEDVEKSIPPKEETLIRVELTKLQKSYYKAILERNRAFLMRGAAHTAVANLINIEMELRKCCNHPFLLRGAEARETMTTFTREDRVDVMVSASGKMVLLDKLLPRLASEGHRVLIFSQFKGMLSLIEELLNARNYKYERIDGSIRGNERQAAIDRYNKPGSDIFAFLLSTKAGGQGINLTAADTVVIFDSDWNPQNDVQV